MVIIVTKLQDYVTTSPRFLPDQIVTFTNNITDFYSAIFLCLFRRVAKMCMKYENHHHSIQNSALYKFIPLELCR